MTSSPLFFILLCVCIKICSADHQNLQDFCPTATTTKQTIFVNGFPCKDPSNITASDFKSSKMNGSGDTDNFLRSAVTIVTAADFPGLNTLGLSVARTDLEVDGMVVLHSHPRATETLFVYKGVVLAGFLDTQNQLFQTKIREGDVFVFPRGLPHFCVNVGFEVATLYSVLNSQNPGEVSISGAYLEPDKDMLHKLVNNYI
ncbi:Cupin_1 domain-containing protein [Cephalotus follicularis]|uniref:Germin-like protein n=1 Tax=Cephalotus follicularis TaxID=3775 RepID=A0A1Q3B3S0_CEPFO|nr:Cupin_1 domain-containing protein [Cephalotus follicularis]